MKKMIQWVLAAILTICGIMNAQAETLRGTVKDAVTGEALIGATVKSLEADNAAAAGIIDGTPIYKKGERNSRNASTLAHGMCVTTRAVSHCQISSTVWISKVGVFLFTVYSLRFTDDYTCG